MAQPHTLCNGRANTINRCSMMAKPSSEESSTQPVLMITAPVCNSHTIQDQTTTDSAMVKKKKGLMRPLLK